MSDINEKLVKLIKPIFDISEMDFCPASEKQISEFKKVTLEKGVPEKVTLELIKFYETTNGIPCLDSLSIHKINDLIIFEWWDDNELWLGQRDFYTIRWKDNKYHLGDASNLNYGEEYISDSLIGLLEIGFNQWYSDDDIFEQ